MQQQVRLYAFFFICTTTYSELIQDARISDIKEEEDNQSDGMLVLLAMRMKDEIAFMTLLAIDGLDKAYKRDPR
jgi:hypothetical protein